jgi:hypothetical protein
MVALNAASELPFLASPSMIGSSGGTASFPAKSDFAIPEGVTYINCAYIHPLPIAGLEALRAYGDRRTRPEAVSKPLQKKAVDLKAEFAALINAKKSEISFIPNTSTGENLVVNGLDVVHSGGNVVTDALHFEGATRTAPTYTQTSFRQPGILQSTSERATWIFVHAQASNGSWVISGWGFCS